MRRSSLYVLLDANIIIEAHMQGVWASLIHSTTLIIPSSVIEEADGYRDAASGAYMPIHLEPDLTSGQIRKAEATAEQIAALRARFDTVFLQRMDRGETEALALLAAGALPEARFCTADGPAIRALSLLEIPDVGISFEALLQQIGFTHTLRDHFSERWFRDMQARGAQEYIRGEGLRQSSSQTGGSKQRRGKPRSKP